MQLLDPLIREGDTVVISGGAVLKTALIRKHQMIRIGTSGAFNVGSLIGHRFGDVFEYDQKMKVLRPTALHPDLDRSALNTEDVEGKDNRDLLDINVAQTLTEEEILKRKEENGLANIVDKLVESSATFEKKTAFSQEKYVRRKKTKYAVLFKVDRVTCDLVGEVYCPSRVELLSPIPDSRHLRLRVDTLAQLLSHANVHSHTRCIVRDNTNGVLPAAVLERMSNDGVVYHALPRHCHANTHIARWMRLTNVLERWQCLPYSQFLVEDIPEPETAPPLAAAAPASATPAPVAANGGNEPDAAPRPNEEGDEGGDVGQPTTSGNADAPVEKPSRWMKSKVARELFAAEPVDSLIVAEGEPQQAVLDLIQFVAFGGAIVVYCPYLEPLCQLFGALRDQVVCMRLWDTWLREYQVLPGRTHPTVNMNAAGGYILSGVRVEPLKGGYEAGEEEAEGVQPKDDVPVKRKRY